MRLNFVSQAAQLVFSLPAYNFSDVWLLLVTVFSYDVSQFGDCFSTIKSHIVHRIHIIIYPVFDDCHLAIQSDYYRLRNINSSKVSPLTELLLLDFCVTKLAFSSSFFSELWSKLTRTMRIVPYVCTVRTRWRPRHHPKWPENRFVPLLNKDKFCETLLTTWFEHLESCVT